MNKRKKSHLNIDYIISILMMAILVASSILAPRIFNYIGDRKDLNKIHGVERETFDFSSPLKNSTAEQVQKMFTALNEKDTIQRTLHLSGDEVQDYELFYGVRNALEVCVQYNLIPDILYYNLEDNVIYADYYNLRIDTTGNRDIAFWVIRFSDYETFDFVLRVDAAEYIIYQAEFFCEEVYEYTAQLMSGNEEVSSALNDQFMEGAASYYEAEGYEAITDLKQGDMAMQLGFERDQYAYYRAHCTSGYVEGEGIRWGFVPMTILLENSQINNDWGYKGIEQYYKEQFGVDLE